MMSTHGSSLSLGNPCLYFCKFCEIPLEFTRFKLYLLPVFPIVKWPMSYFLRLVRRYTA